MKTEKEIKKEREIILCDLVHSIYNEDTNHTHRLVGALCAINYVLEIEGSKILDHGMKGDKKVKG